MTASYTARFGAADHDLGPRPLGVLADHCYVVCSTPRSGSNLLGDAMRTSGDDLGVPMEYLDATSAEPALAHRWGTTDLATYLAQLHARRTSASGWFGLKAHWHQLQAFFERLDGRAWTDDRAPELRLVVEQLFPDTRWIHLSRADVVGAAVSMYRATTTGHFASFEDGAAPPADPVLDRGAVLAMLGLVDRFRGWDAAWRSFFEGAGIEPFVVTYAGLVADVDGTVAAVREWLGVGPGRAASPGTRRQADDWSAQARARVEEALDQRRRQHA